MKLSAITVVIGVLAACALQPSLDHRDAIVEVRPFHSASLAQIRVARSDNGTNLQHLFEHVAIDGPLGSVRYRV